MPGETDQSTDEWSLLLRRVQELEQAASHPPMLEQSDTGIVREMPQVDHYYPSPIPSYKPEQSVGKVTLLERLHQRRTSIGLVIAAIVLGGGAAAGVRLAQSEQTVANTDAFRSTTIEPSQPVEPDLIAPAPSSSAEMPSIAPSPDLVAGEDTENGKNDNKGKKKNNSKKTPETAGAGSAKFSFGTFNIFHSTGNGARDWQRRARLSVAAINRFDLDVVALQEARMNQQRFIDNITSTDAQKKKKTDIFDIFPYDSQKFGFKGNDRIERFTPNPIMWDRTKFSFIKYETTNIRYFGGSIKKAYAVLLENKITGGKTWFVSFHDPADARGEARQYRLSNAKEYKSWWAELAKTAPVVAGGDANSGLQLRYGNNDTVDNNPENLTCEVIVEGGTMAYASDVLKYSDIEDQENFLDKVHSDCSSTDMFGGDPIDLIFTSTRGDSKVEVHAYKKSGKGRTVNGSDVHPLYAVTLSTDN